MGQEATVRTGHRTTDWFQIGKGIHRGCICHAAYLTYVHSISCEMPTELEPRLLGKISTTSYKQMIPL